MERTEIKKMTITGNVLLAMSSAIFFQMVLKLMYSFQAIGQGEHVLQTAPAAGIVRLMSVLTKERRGKSESCD